MKKLIQTSEDFVKGRTGKHYHIAYVEIDEATGSVLDGITTTEKDHFHSIENNQVAPAGDGKGHTHTLKEYETTEKEDREKDDKIIKDVISLFKEAKGYEDKSRKKAIESEDFYNGKQWKEEDKSTLEKSQRSALTINEIEPKIDLLSGYQRQNRTDFRFLPVEEGDAIIADLLNVIVKNIVERCNYDHEETDIFEDTAITGRGLINVYVDYGKDMRGEIIIERFPWGDCYFGPHEKRDAADCEYLIKTKWYSKARLKQLYPDKIKDINREIDLFDKEDTPHLRTPGTQYDNSENTVDSIVNADPDLIDLAKKEFRILECWRKVYEQNRVIANVEDDFYFNAKGWKVSDINSVKNLPSFNVIERVVTKIRVTRVASKVLLDDEFPELAVDDFFILPVYAKKRGAEWWGKIENLKDIQKEINKRHSQAVDIINKVASYGYYYDKQTFDTPEKAAKFRQNVSSPGFAIEIMDVNRPPLQTEGVKFPAEIVQLEQISSQKLRELMNVNTEFEGRGQAGTSGVAMVERKRQALIGNEFLFDNLDAVKRKLGRILVALIQKHYTPERIMRIVENQNKRQPVSLGGQPLESVDKEEVLSLLTESDLTKYDIVVSQSPFSASMREANFAIWIELAKTRPEIPLDWLIELSDLPDKEKFKAILQEQMEAARAQEDKKYQTELAKTAMAKGLPMGGGGGGGGMPPMGGGGEGMPPMGVQ